MKTHHLIIGASAGAISAIEAIRSIDGGRASITVISDERPAGYSKPMLPEFLAGEVDIKGILFRDEAFWRRNKVRLIYGRVSELDLDCRKAKVSGNPSILELEYERLLVATGGKPIISQIEGLENVEKYTFTTLGDAEGLANRLPETSNVAVIGGGLIGVGLSEALIKLGKRVVLIELKPHILSQVLDEKASGILEDRMRRAGVEIRTGHTVARVHWRSHPEKPSYAELDDGDRIPCQQIIMAIGVTPNVELASKAGVETGKGIIVNERMETSIPGVYACGDAVELYDFAHEGRRPLPLWPVARWTGKTAGYNMAGSSRELQGATSMSAMKYFGVPIVSVGHVNPGSQDGYEVEAYLDPARRVYRKIVIKDERIAGFILLGEICDAGIMYYLMRSRVDVRRIKGRIPTRGLGLVHLPRRVRKELLRR
ncbi:MAG: FAD-dependent oxidoreductase [Candidatus Bathyarchaeia archaeon]